MRWLLVLGLWGMLAGVAGAEHITHDGCNTCEQIGPSIYNCTAMLCVDQAQIQEFERKIQVHKTDACYQQMQAAMEAMEKQFYYKHGGRMIFPFKPDGEPIPGDVGPLIDKWAEAKACWRKP